MLDLARERPLTPAPVGEGARRDPVCGMAIGDLNAAPRAGFGGETYIFCSERCRARFEADSERYVRALERPARRGETP